MKALKHSKLIRPKIFSDIFSSNMKLEEEIEKEHDNKCTWINSSTNPHTMELTNPTYCKECIGYNTKCKMYNSSKKEKE